MDFTKFSLFLTSAVLIAMQYLQKYTVKGYTCSGLPSRYDCNKSGGGESRCDDLRCCYEPSGSVWCALSEPCATPSSERFPCGQNVNNEHDCFDRNCCWFQETQNRGDCFLKTGCALDVFQRIRCESSSMADCLFKGCCYDDGGDSHIPNCYHSKVECSSLEVKDRINCGSYGAAACTSRGCCYESSHSPTCFYATTCPDHYFSREQTCIDCNCADVCYKDNGRCDSSCNTGYIGMDCQSDGSPTITDLNQETFENSGQPVTFSCDVRGNVVHANEIVLLVRSTPYTHTYTGGGSHPEYIRTNTFEEVLVSAVDTVTCQVQAHGGHDELDIEVEAYVQPTLTSPPWLSNINKTRMTVHWNAWNDTVDIGDAPVEKYEVWYARASDNFKLYGECPDNVTSMVVHNLDVYTEYSFAIRTHRPGVGGGGDLSPTVTNRTLCDNPMVVTNLHAEATSPSDIEITWSEPIRMECPLIGYLLSYSQTSHYECDVTKTYPPVRLDATTMQYTLTDLYPHTEYRVNVQSFGEGGLGPVESVMTSTNEGRPTKPTDLQATAVSDSALKTQWRAPECPNGVISSFMLQYWETDSRSKAENDTVPVVSNQSDFVHTVQALRAETMYTLKVLAENFCCNGDWSDETTAITDGKSTVGAVIITCIVICLVVIAVAIAIVYGMRTGKIRKGNEIIFCCKDSQTKDQDHAQNTYEDVLFSESLEQRRDQDTPKGDSTRGGSLEQNSGRGSFNQYVEVEETGEKANPLYHNGREMSEYEISEIDV
ncbi:tyrosine-protein kinase receptor Tie-1-like [Ptychodera flava]|uniref:tyrosine-protein kinase receptor Tie-1-like n=1 Tax=Ptychodera flava TaxID=63121 RepID=UPI00396A630A